MQQHYDVEPSTNNNYDLRDAMDDGNDKTEEFD
jgi:hypothetical protein